MLQLIVFLVISVTGGAFAAWEDGHCGAARIGVGVIHHATAANARACGDLTGTPACASWNHDLRSSVCTLNSDAPAWTRSEGTCSGTTGNTLQPRAFTPLRTGAVTPSGWLAKQLQIQADGLSGHLSLFWNDIAESVWVGGNGDGSLHERAPYWLNGIVPLAYLLKVRMRGVPVWECAVGTRPYSLCPQNTETATTQGVATPAAATATGALCQNGTDMPYGDITSFAVQDAAACAFACNGTSNCVGFVVDDCDPSAVTCWLKGTMGTIVNAPCRCARRLRVRVCLCLSGGVSRAVRAVTGP
jgi:hypothetical protein